MAMIRPETEMKDSGIQWLGNVPKEWSVGKVKHEFYATKTIVGDKVNDYERLALTLNGVIKRSKDAGDGLQPEKFDGYQILKEHELVFKLIDLANVSTSRVGLSPYTGIVSPAYIVLHHRKDMNPRYGEYYFLSMWMNEVFNHIGGDGVRSALNAKDLLNIPYLKVPADEQQAIANYLDKTCSKIDEIIAEAKASIDEYKNLRESLISNATTQGIKKNRCMKSSGVEWVLEIPSDWDMIPAKVLFSQSNERKHVDDVQLTASQKYGIISQVEYMKRENSRIVIATQGIENWKHVEPNDFIISLRSFQGGLEKSDVSGCITWHYVVLKANNGVYYDYFKWLFKSDKYINALQGTCNFIRNGQDLRFSNFVQVPLLVVPIEEQKEIADYLNKKVPKIDSLISEKESLIHDLEAYKKSLIYEVVTGKRRVV